MRRPVGVVLHQTLHGYRNGHRLLATSVSLSQTDQQVMLGLSDTADFRYASSLPHLLSGYPLPDQGFYVLAMTWPAPEQRRPGCVWTHSLLVDTADLGRLRFPDGLLGLYRRPDLAEQGFLTPFATPIEHSDTRTPDLAGVPEDLLRTLIWAIYEPPPRPVAAVQLPVEPENGARLLLRVWGQQWPELRRSFSFAEAVTPRHLEGQVFDLQLAEVRQRRTSADFSGVRIVNGVPDVRLPGWCTAASDDLRSPGELTRFLATYGPESRTSRATLATLAQIWVATRQSAPGRIQELASTVRSAFPQSSEVPQLRMALFGPSPERSGGEDLPILLALLSAPEVAGDTLDQMEISNRAAAVARTAAGAAALLSALADNPNRSRIAGGLVAGLVRSPQTDGVLQAVSSHQESFALLVRRHPRIATLPSVWSGIDDAQQLWLWLRDARPARSIRIQIIRAMLDVDAHVDRADLLDRWPEASVTVLEWLSGNREASSAAAWVSALSPEHVTDWLLSHTDAELLEALASAWSSDALAAIPEQVWLEASWSPEASHDEELTRLFAASLRWLVSERGVIAAELFDRLFRKAVGNRLDAACLKDLRTLTPDLPDAPPERRLARAMNRALRGATSPEAAFGVTDRDGFAQILQEDKSRGLARRLAQALTADPTIASTWQIAVIDKSVASKNRKGNLVKTVEDAFNVVRKLG
jgi:hypothetical protein